MFKHGIVAGKFWPLHKGHDALIRTALRQCERVTVFVVWLGDQEPSGLTRQAWVQAAYPQADVRLVVDICTDDNHPDSSVTWAEYTKDILEGDLPDAVFSSEPYGTWWAANMGAQHVQVNLNRSYFPISGTMIRSDPYKYFHYIHPIARAYYNKRVLVVGAESTGKTTLCADLAIDYSTVFVPEYGRIYVENKASRDGVDERACFGEIVNRQLRMEEEYLKDANRVLFCDTDLFTTSLWWERWMGTGYDRLWNTIQTMGIEHAHKYDLVLVMDHEGTEWVDDGFRDQRDTRAWFTENLENFFRSVVVKEFYPTDERPLNVVKLSGSWEERHKTAIAAVNEIFGQTEALLPRS
jgi:NadR type nicotinamide-nucleotide adenylyltransferase